MCQSNAFESVLESVFVFQVVPERVDGIAANYQWDIKGERATEYSSENSRRSLGLEISPADKETCPSTSHEPKYLHRAVINRSRVPTE